MLFVLHLLFLAFEMQTSRLYTKLSLPSGLLNTVAILTAAIHSFIEDQRSLRPSDLLVMYLSASTVLFIPRLRSLWLIPSVHIPRALWTAVFIVTVAVVLVESMHKTRFLRPIYKNITSEQTMGFWGKSSFIWVLPLFQAGYSKILRLEDIPEVDIDLQESSTWADLNRSWHRLRGHHRLLKATFFANSQVFHSAIVPRLALSAFTFCQPFLVSSSVLYISSRLETDNNMYGPALVGAFLLTYFGIAVSKLSTASYSISHSDVLRCPGPYTGVRLTA